MFAFLSVMYLNGFSCRKYSVGVALLYNGMVLCTYVSSKNGLYGESRGMAIPNPLG